MMIPKRTLLWGFGLMFYTIGIRYWDIVSKDWKGILLIALGLGILGRLQYESELKEIKFAKRSN